MARMAYVQKKGLKQAGRQLQRILLPLMLLLGCLLPAASSAQAQAAPLKVVASFSILADLAQRVGGEDIDLQVIVGPLNDVHSYEPSAGDVQALAQAQVLIANGLNFETWLPRLMQATNFKGTEVIAAQGVEPRRLTHAHEHHGGHDHHGDHNHGDIDPHAWQDPANAIIYVQNIAHAFAALDPEHAEGFARRAQKLITDIRLADHDWRTRLSAIAPDKRVFATTHDAFGYFAQAYDIKILPLAGLTGQAEPSAQAMAQLIQAVRAQKVAALFAEYGSNTQALEQIARETGARLAGPIFADTLDSPGQPAGSYLGMFLWNTGQLLQALQD